MPGIDNTAIPNGGVVTTNGNYHVKTNDGTFHEIHTAESNGGGGRPETCPKYRNRTSENKLDSLILDESTDTPSDDTPNNRPSTSPAPSDESQSNLVSASTTASSDSLSHSDVKSSDNQVEPFNGESPSKSSPAPSRRKRLQNLRAKSDVGAMLGKNHLRRMRSKSMDMDSKDNSHSDSENAIDPVESQVRPGASPTANAHYKKKSFLGSTNMSEFFQNDHAGSAIKRRLSQFNTDALGGGLSRNLRNMKITFTRRRKEEVPPEVLKKSAELMSELTAIAPAVNVLGYWVQRDERNQRRVPVLLDQIRFVITQVARRQFKIDLEYGSGPARLAWSVTKDWREITMLHTRLRSLDFQVNFTPRNRGAKRVKFPKLPKMKRRHRKQNLTRTFSAIGTGGAMAGPAASATVLGTRISHERTGASGLNPVSSAYSSASDSTCTSIASEDGQVEPTAADAIFIKALAEYFQRLLFIYRARVEANKICQFFELSSMSIRLAPEQSYHGKEGPLFIRSFASHLGWRVSHWRPDDLQKMINRHTNKWFMVRHSYIMCVDNMTTTTLLEVFLVDSGFKIRSHHLHPTSDTEDEVGKTQSKYFFELENNERRLKLTSKSERVVDSWIESINYMKEHTIYSQEQRFGSFAPIRKNVYAQWFVDARDYFWTISEAISMARDVIYIHDWWLSPELYLRRAPEGNQEWRIDRLLKRKAEEGVKIFVVVYRNYGQTIPIDSSWTKHSLLDLHPNIYVVRSPNQWLQNTYFWAHHEKICIVDHTIAFLGGIDLCFGRWDTPDHVLTDDAKHAFGSPEEGGFQMWPGKDYSNPRVADFSSLDRPFEDMYDRMKVPRMPWHDVHMMTVGQPARDLARHFVQRWNYLLRQKRPSRYTPLLLPPPEFTEEEVRQLNLAGTCEVQVLRSGGGWSTGLKETEMSIQTAYLKAIETSQHFVYIENQFFITSTTLENTKIENRIGDALVERIIRAHQNGENWRAVIVIPLMPGFESQVDMREGSSVRVIMQCQYMSISRGQHSIFRRLEQVGIHPDDYIQFFSLRKWGKIGPSKKLVTEQLYIHAKTMIVDDRIAIIGSANINERSMRGSRDSEIASMIRDSHMLNSHMGGEKWPAGKFAHTLRMRLMREHLGIDIDVVDYIERRIELERESSAIQLSEEQAKSNGQSRAQAHSVFEPEEENTYNFSEIHSFNHCVGVDNIGLREKKAMSYDPRIQGNPKHRQDVDGYGEDGWKKDSDHKSTQSKATTDPGKQHTISAGLPQVDEIDKIWSEESCDDVLEFKRRVYCRMTGIRAEGDWLCPWEFDDPLRDDFYFDRWLACAQNNTAAFRDVFRCQPDDEVSTWKDYKEWTAYGEKFSNEQDKAANMPLSSAEATARAHSPLNLEGGKVTKEDEKKQEKNSELREHKEREIDRYQQDKAEGRDHPEDDLASSGRSPRQSHESDREDLNSVDTDHHYHPHHLHHQLNGHAHEDLSKSSHDGHGIRHSDSAMEMSSRASATESRARRRMNNRMNRKMFSCDQVYDYGTAERKLQKIQGHLVLFPADWLSRELEAGNWFYNLDRIPPLEIYD